MPGHGMVRHGLQGVPARSHHYVKSFDHGQDYFIYFIYIYYKNYYSIIGKGISN